MEQCEMCGRWRFMMEEGETPYSLHPFFCSRKCRDESGVSSNSAWSVYGSGPGGWSFGIESPDRQRGDAE